MGVFDVDKREWAGREKKVSKVDKGERVRWKRRVGEVGKKSEWGGKGK
jgi:hypothetical protein